MFVHLHVHSYFSFLRGANSIEDLCAACKKRGMNSLALTETNGLYGLIWFLQAAREYEITPIIGAEIITGDERAVLLAMNLAGYQALSTVLTARHLAADNFSLVTALEGRRENLVILSDSSALLLQLKQKFGPTNLYTELVPGNQRKALINFSRKHKIPPVATNNVTFVNSREYPVHRLLRAIDLNTCLSRIPANELTTTEAWLKSPAEMAQVFPDCPEALQNTVRIAEQCVFTLDFGRLIFPSQRKKQPAYERLKQKCYVGALERYGRITPAVSNRMEYELKIIREKGFADYFLVVEDIVRTSSRTCGRGSAAASLVSYCLKITHVDPIKYDLFFERFLNPGRQDPPDIDVDFAWDERDDVLDYVFKKYGTESSAMISNHVTFKGRGSVREVAKVYGLPEYEINSLTKKLRSWSASTVSELIKEDPLFKDHRLGGEWKEILALAERIHGFPRHLSVHCGGVVIALDGLANYVPLERAAKGVQVIQWEKDQAEAAGLVKIDLLGNRSLAVIRDALGAVKRNYNIQINYTKWNPLHDARTKELIRQGDTMGVFYVESPAMRQLQKKAGMDDFEHLVIHSSIIRPAANPYIQEYLERLKGKSWQPLHPLLKEILDESFGIMVYQEDVSKAAIALADFTPTQADQLRKTLSKKNNARQLRDFREQFFEGAYQKRVAYPEIEKIWNMILSFSGYSFCKPHSASYALVSFKSAYLRAHYPAEFMAAVISNCGGYYSPLAYISEARRMGLKILPLDINESRNEYWGYQKYLQVGFMQLKGINRKSIQQILLEQEKNGRFKSFRQFLKRTRIDSADTQILIKAGAFDRIEIMKNRPTLIWQLKQWEESHRRRESQSKFNPGIELSLFEHEFSRLPEVEDYNEHTKIKHEMEIFGFPIIRHPLHLYQERISRIHPVEAKMMKKFVGRLITMVGWLVTGKLVSTKHNELMEFFSFEDLTALYETTFFPKAYKRFCHIISSSRPYILKGKVESNFGVVSLNVLEVRYL